MPEMHVDQDPVTVLGEALRDSSHLKGYARVYVGSDGRARVTDAKRIVLYPIAGGLTPRNKGEAIIDVDLDVAMAVWAEDLPRLWRLLVRVSRAIKDHMVAAGYFVQWRRLEFDVETDTGEQGEMAVMTVTMTGLPFLPEDPTYGLVDSVSYDETLTH